MSRPAYELRTSAPGDGRVEVHLSGRLELPDAGRLRDELLRSLEDAGAGWRLDLTAVSGLDGGVAAVVADVRRQAEARSAAVEVVCPEGAVSEVLALYGARAPRPSLRGAARPQDVFLQIGEATLYLFTQAKAVLDYVGRVVQGVALAIRRPRSVQWRDVGPLMERAGADGVPIVFMILFLIGLVTAYQSAVQMRQFGADALVADVIALSITRELGPLMTAIIVAGRSGAAYAAEIGTMRVSEEVDALRTLGLCPIRFLVFPRVIALTLMVPLLTLLADVFGIVGGLVSALASLDVTFHGYVTSTVDAIDLWDVFGGLLKALVFGFLVALISCERGLATRGGAAGVGRSTTSAVVVCLFNLVAADSLITIIYQRFDV